MAKQTAIIWFRRDLRLSDNPALSRAREFDAIIPLFIWAPEEEAPWSPGAASRWWYHHSLNQLDESLKKLGTSLIVRHGDSQSVLEELLTETGAQAVFWNRLYEPATIKRDAAIKLFLKNQGLIAESFNGSLLKEPWEVKTTTGGPYQVYTPFSRAVFRDFSNTKPLPSPRTLPPLPKKLQSEAVSSLKLLPTIRWDASFLDHYSPGEAAAKKQLKHFLDTALPRYFERRDFPAEQCSSALSAHLHFGEISPHQVWHQAVTAREAANSTDEKQLHSYLRQLIWRDFAYHLLFHFPHTDKQPLRKEFAKFPWKKSASLFRHWQRGQTGYPIVDAGMRELWTTGIMHNRVRMIVASFLIKDLFISWQDGAQWFWDTLLDADLANNTLGWQWTAGCGADAAPFFRIFNPILQGEKFDKDGSYIRRWVPELAALPNKWIHKPFAAPEGILKTAGITLSKQYPKPIVDHAAQRDAALRAYEKIKGRA